MYNSRKSVELFSKSLLRATSWSYSLWIKSIRLLHCSYLSFNSLYKRLLTHDDIVVINNPATIILFIIIFILFIFLNLFQSGNGLNVWLPAEYKLCQSCLSFVRVPANNQFASLCCCFGHWLGNSTNYIDVVDC